MNLEKVKDISIYLTSRCNYNCTYCDRKYVVPSEIYESDITNIIKFISYCFKNGCKPNIISFHGGEPFLKANLMKDIIYIIENEVKQAYPEHVSNLKYFIQTNGSLILKHVDMFSFLDTTKLIYSISYDLIYQEKHRKKLDINNVIQYLTSKKYNVKLQCVVSPIEINDPLFHSNFLHTCLTYNINSFCLIILKHIRRGNYSQVVLKKEELALLAMNLLKIIELSYIYGFNLLIDGKNNAEEKSYFSDHEQIVLSGDGYIYPEYDFLDYKIEEARIGKWKDDILFYTGTKELNINETCKTCNLTNYCGLKYVYYFNKEAPDKNICTNIYNIITNLQFYMAKLKQKNKLCEWIINEK